MKKIFQSATFAISAAVLIFMCFTGCVITNFFDMNALTPKGDRQIYEFQTGEYSGIKIEGTSDVRYYSAPSSTVTLAVQPNLREYYTVEVINGELVLRAARRINSGSGKNPVLTVSTPVLNRMIIEGSGNFTAYDKIKSNSLTLVIRGSGTGKAELDADNLSVDLSGAGKFELSGRADKAGLSLSGAGEINALQLQTREASVNLSGAGTVKVSCQEKLLINANGAGNVDYRGTPSLSLNTGGMVSIRQLD